MRWLYSLFVWLLQPLLYAKLRWRARLEPGYAEAIAERFGHYREPASAPENDRLLVWVHAVSLGETRAVAPLITQLRQALPGMRLLLTHGTATGRAQGRMLLQTGDIQVWQHWAEPVKASRRSRPPLAWPSSGEMPCPSPSRSPPGGAFWPTFAPTSACWWKPKSGPTWWPPALKPLSLCVWSTHA